MQEQQTVQQVIVLSPFIKVIVLPVAGALCTLVIYYIKEMRDDIRDLNRSIVDSFKNFAPREETEHRIYSLEHTQMEHGSRLSSIEEWQRSKTTPGLSS